MLERHSSSTRAFLATFSKQRSSRSKDSARSASATARRAATKSWSRSRHPSHACGRCSKACRRRCSSARTHTSNSTARSRAFARSTPVASPYEGRPGAAFWALLGPDVELRHTEYDLDEAVRRYRATDDPLAEQMVEILLTPATPDQVVEHAEALELSG